MSNVREANDKLEKLLNQLREITTTGSIATVAVPLGMPLRRSAGKSSAECRAQANQMFPKGTPNRAQAISDFVKSCVKG